MLSLLLAWLAIVGAVNAWFVFNGEVTGLHPAFGFAGMLYSISALAACIGLWRMRSWSLRALHGWMILCLLIFAGFAIRFDDFIRGGVPGLVGFSIFIGLFFLGIHRYVDSKFSTDDG